MPKFTLLSALLFVESFISAAPAQNLILMGIDDLNDWAGCPVGHPQISPLSPYESTSGHLTQKANS